MFVYLVQKMLFINQSLNAQPSPGHLPPSQKNSAKRGIALDLVLVMNHHKSLHLCAIDLRKSARKITNF